jgi:ribonuclease VapC
MIDASVLLAIILREADAGEQRALLAGLRERFTTPAAIGEVCLRLASFGGAPADAIEHDVREMLMLLDIDVRGLEPDCWPWVLRASLRFGKGRHSARLNFGDCLAYAAAKQHRARLIYKGDDFALTDVNEGY